MDPDQIQVMITLSTSSRDWASCTELATYLQEHLPEMSYQDASGQSMPIGQNFDLTGVKVEAIKS